MTTRAKRSAKSPRIEALVRDDRFSTELFDRYQRSEKARVSALAEMYVQAPSVTWIVT